MKKLFALVAFVLLPSLALAQGAITVSDVDGPVEIRAASGKTFSPLAASRRVQIGDQIRTGYNAGLMLHLPDGSYMTIAENSTVTIEDAPNSGYRDIVSVLLGKIRLFIHGPTANPYRVKTPTALIAVRGTTFEIAVDEAQTTLVSCMEGRVGVESVARPDREVILDAGRKTLVRAGEAPLTPVSLDQAINQNRSLTVVARKNSENLKGQELPEIGIAARDNDRGKRLSRPNVSPSLTDPSVARGKPTLNYPE